MKKQLRIAAIPVLLIVASSCSAAEVQANAQTYLHQSIPTDQATMVADFVNGLESAVAHHGPDRRGRDHGHGHSDHPTTTTTTASTTTTTTAPTA